MQDQIGSLEFEDAIHDNAYAALKDQIKNLSAALEGQFAELENIRKELNDAWGGRIEEYKAITEASAALLETATGLQRLNPQPEESNYTPAGKEEVKTMMKEFIQRPRGLRLCTISFTLMR